MSHEQSETITRPSGAYNVYGGTQYPLSPVFGFEQARYESVPQAVNAAQWRSRMGGGPEGGQSPVYGFQSQPQPEYIGFLKQVVAGLMDPRTQALLAPGMALTKAPQAAWNATRVLPNVVSERGNWNPFGWLARPNSMDPRPELNMNVPLSHMREQISNTPNARGFVEHIEDINKISRVMREGNETIKPMSAQEQMGYLAHIRETNPHLARQVEDTILGQRKLQVADNGAWASEGPPPPEMVKRLFGY